MIKEALREFSQELINLSKKHEQEKDQKCAQIILARTGLEKLREKLSSKKTGE